MAKKSTKDELAGILADSLNKKFKNSSYRTAFFLDGTGDSPSEIKGWVKTGSSMLDLAVSNRPNGDFPLVELLK